jgi:hypothetical protein
MTKRGEVEVFDICVGGFLARDLDPPGWAESRASNLSLTHPPHFFLYID